MSKFFGSGKISPELFLYYKIKRLECLPISKNVYIGRSHGGVIISNGNNHVPRIVDTGSSNDPAIVDCLSGEPQTDVGGNYKSENGRPSNHINSKINGFSAGKMNSVPNFRVSNVLSNSSNDVTNKSPRVGDSRGDSGTASRDDDSKPVEGNMCASSTGVVRLQSRKKAEMFLVRTDGFSCTREKVTESSLAFTHPTTQQQMLMWKSVPKTVSLLKKMGEELMEEAKQVRMSSLVFQGSKNHSAQT